MDGSERIHLESLYSGKPSYLLQNGITEFAIPCVETLLLEHVDTTFTHVRRKTLFHHHM
jgi:hypothetical protein